MLSPAPRVVAARCAAAVFARGRNLDEVFAEQVGQLNEADRGLAKAIAYGAVRDRRLLEALLDQLLQRPLRNEPELHSLLLCGLFQLRAMRIAPHAAVSETVAAVQALDKPWAKGLANALLRRYQRESTALETALPATPAVRLSYPDWLVDALRNDWGDKAEAVLEAGNAPGPLTLRVNRRRGSRETYLQQLAEVGIAATAVDGAADAVRLIEATGVERIPGFADGRVSVQDASAQLTVELLDAQPGMRVLDACAAPGGKAAHLLEHQPDLQLLALDSDAARLSRVQHNLDRLQLTATLRCADAARPSTWWDEQPYARILVDAPCSGSGVIRRHPDIKWLRRAADIPRLAAQQRRLLDALWPLLSPGGVLVYASCSILRAEGEDLIAGFVAARADAEALPIDMSWGESTGLGRRIAPGGDFDGFYYARLRKR